jgi:hypothetical protein
MQNILDFGPKILVTDRRWSVYPFSVFHVATLASYSGVRMCGFWGTLMISNG